MLPGRTRITPLRLGLRLMLSAALLGLPHEELLRLLRPGGVILVDNVLWGGSVIDAGNNEASTVAIRAFNDRVAADERVDCVMLPISDGLTLLRKR